MRLADFILANVEPILVEWESFARSIWPSGATADPAEVRDEAEYFDDIQDVKITKDILDLAKHKSWALRTRQV